MYKDLPPATKTVIRELVPIIMATIRAEKIILLPSFKPLPPDVPPDEPPGSADLNLLVITQPSEKKAEYEIKDALETKCFPIAPVYIIIHDITYVHSRLTQGNFFFYTIIKEGLFLYDRSQHHLVDPAPPDFKKIAQKAAIDHRWWWRQANGFYDAAEFSLKNGIPNLAAFFLHQSAESAYQDILCVCTGYKPKTHNLEILRRASALFSDKIHADFLVSIEERKQVYQLLKNAYVDARYNLDYMITGNQLEKLFTHLQVLLTETLSLSTNRMAEYDAKIDTSHSV